MCDYITLVAATDDRDALHHVMRRHGRRAHPIANPSIGTVLRPGERQYLTWGRNCDCGTVLGRPPETPAATDSRLEQDTAKLRRKGWSEAKVARALDDRRRAESRPPPEGIDSVPFWADVLDDVATTLGLRAVGLLVHAYSGGLEDERFDVLRREIPAGRSHEALASMRQDELLIFRHTA